jgi:hypothetical protein
MIYSRNFERSAYESILHDCSAVPVQCMHQQGRIWHEGPGSGESKFGGVSRWQQTASSEHWRWPHWPPINHQSQVRRQGLAPLRTSEADRARSGGSHGGLARFKATRTVPPPQRLQQLSVTRRRRCNRRCIVVTFKLMSAIIIPAANHPRQGRLPF